MQVKVTRRYAAPIEEVFAAWTDAASMGAWMNVDPGPAHSVELDVRVGGKFRIWMGRGKPEVEITGEYVEVQTPRRLVFTWSSFATGGVSLVTVNLSPAGTDATDVVLVHEQLPNAESARGHEAGWIKIAARLAERWATNKASQHTRRTP